MVIQRLVLSWLSRLVLMVWAALWLAAPAQGAVYTGIWDPTYGDPFTNLGWRGSAEFFVPDACKPSGTADVSNPQQCDGLAAFLSAEVNFYDTTDADRTTIATLDFDPNSLLIGTLRFVDGALTELTTTLSNFVPPGVDLSRFGVPAATEFSLQFTLDGPRLAQGTCNADNRECVVAGFNDGVRFPPIFVITEVPEPTTLWLASLALLALAGVGRAGSAKRRG
jgi:PEP-CTERM motif